MTTPTEALARAWSDLPPQFQAHPGIKALHRAALAQQPSAPSAEPLKGWKLNHVQYVRGSGTAQIGYLDPEDDRFSPIVTVDTGLYYEKDQAAPLAVAILGAIADATAPTAPAPLPALTGDMIDRIHQALLDTADTGDGDYAAREADQITERILRGCGAAPLMATTGSAPSAEPADDACICRGNWRLLVKEMEPQIGAAYTDVGGKEWRFAGLLHGDDDYYYCMVSDGKAQFLSCVGSIEAFGLEAKAGAAPLMANGLTEPNRAFAITLLKAAAQSGDPGAINLAAQLAGTPACEGCGYVAQHCRCTAETAATASVAGLAEPMPDAVDHYGLLDERSPMDRAKMDAMWGAAPQAVPAQEAVAEMQGIGTADFEAWWAAHGQFCRAGGGDYEKTFAFRAWDAARAASPAPASAPQASPAVAAPEPVGWGQLGLRNGHTYVRMHYEGHLYPPPADVARNLNLVPLYASPQAAPVPTVQPLSIPHSEIASLLDAAMNEAVKNGANSISMPDDYVRIAMWLAGIPAATAAQPTKE